MTRRTVEIVEMAPRDGLQNERRIIGTDQKIALVNALSRVGFRRIETASFVLPRRVPQMADGAEVLAGIRRLPGVSYTALVPNMTGFARAMEAGVDGIAVFASASEGFSQANLNCSISESIERFEPVLEAAKAENVQVRGYVSCVTDCPYDGPVAPEAVARVSARLAGMGCHEISLGDTIGAGTPDRIKVMLAVVTDAVPSDRLAGHFHDTNGRALDNIAVALEAGLRVFDASAGGLGGCPFAPGAAGNVATEAVVDRLEALGWSTGLDRAELRCAAELAVKVRTGVRPADGVGGTE
ncbi:MAG: hydroxymethylglutaryl-CoA lyase [Pseudomonadota bacterium]